MTDTAPALHFEQESYHYCFKCREYYGKLFDSELRCALCHLREENRTNLGITESKGKGQFKELFNLLGALK